jgi:hypothetical protein
VSAIFALNPVQALHDYWRHSSPEAHIAVGAGGAVGWAARIDWAAALSFACLAAMTLGGCAIQLWKQYRLACLEIADRERKLSAPAGAASAPPA